jgi:hypothetical protein
MQVFCVGNCPIYNIMAVGYAGILHLVSIKMNTEKELLGACLSTTSYSYRMGIIFHLSLTTSNIPRNNKIVFVIISIKNLLIKYFAYKTAYSCKMYIIFTIINGTLAIWQEEKRDTPAYVLGMAFSKLWKKMELHSKDFVLYNRIP